MNKDLHDIANQLHDAIAAYGPARSSFESEHIARLFAVKDRLMELARVG